MTKLAQRPIQASRRLSAPPGAVLEFLADLDNHALLAPGSVAVLAHDRQHGRCTRAIVRLRGPLLMRRTASTELLQVTESSIRGRAKIGGSTIATIAWGVQPLHNGSLVTLCATVDAASPLDALLLRSGARRWLPRRFAGALEHLSLELDALAYPVAIAPTGSTPAYLQQR